MESMPSTSYVVIGIKKFGAFELNGLNQSAYGVGSGVGGSVRARVLRRESVILSRALII